MEGPWRNKHLSVKEISREEEMERKRKKKKKKKKKDWLDDSSTLEIQSREKDGNMNYIFLAERKCCSRTHLHDPAWNTQDLDSTSHCVTDLLRDLRQVM